MTRRESLLLLLAGALQGESTQGDLEAGYRSLYDLRFTDARSKFRHWQTEHPDDPMGFTSEAASYLFEEFERHGVLTTEFFLDDERLLGGIEGTADPVRTKEFEQANEKAHQIGERSLAKNSNDANALLALTMSTGLEADYESLIGKKHLESLRQIRQAESFGNRLLKVAPNMGDAYMALGAASYIIACLPGYKRAMLWLGGIGGDKKRGLDQLAQAARTGRFLAAYAKMMLALALLREKQPDEAQRLIRELVSEFPDSPLFAREKLKFDRLQR